MEPLLPPEPPRPKGGRPWIPDRQVLAGIVFVLRTGIPWEYLPQKLGYGSGMTCWRRLRDWQAAGVWEQIHHELLNRLHDAGQIDRSRASLDSASVRARGGGDYTGPNLTDRGRPGTKPMWLWVEAGSRLPSSSRPPTSTTAVRSSGRWIPFRRYGVRIQGGPAKGQRKYMRTKPTTSPGAEPTCAGVVSLVASCAGE